MKNVKLLFGIFLFPFIASAQVVDLSGTVTHGISGVPLQGVMVVLKNQSGLASVTDSAGKYRLNNNVVVKQRVGQNMFSGNHLNGNTLVFGIKEKSPVAIEIYSVSGVKVRTIFKGADVLPGTYTVNVPREGLARATYIVRFQNGTASSTHKFTPMAHGRCCTSNPMATRNSAALIKCAAAPVDTLVFSRRGFNAFQVPIYGYTGTYDAVLQPLMNPEAPVIISAIAGNGTVAVSWSSVSGATSYNLYFKAGTTVDTASGKRISSVASPDTIKGLTNGTQYAIAVSAVNSSGESDLSVVQVVTPQWAGPVIMINAIGTINAGTSRNVIGNINADTLITAVSYSITTSNGGAVPSINVAGPWVSNTKSIDFTSINPITITVGANAVAGNYILVILAIAGLTSWATFDFTVVGGGTPMTTTTVTIGSYQNVQFGGSVDLDAGAVMLAMDATRSGSGVDIVGTYSSTRAAFRVFSPYYAANSSGITAFANWQNPANTQICKVSGTAFSSLTKEQIQPLFNAASATDSVSCSTGDVLIVKTDQNAYAAVEITAFDASTAGTATLKIGK